MKEVAMHSWGLMASLVLPSCAGVVETEAAGSGQGSAGNQHAAASTSAPIEGLYAAIDVVADGSGQTKVSVELREGMADGPDVEALGAHSLLASDDDETKGLTQSGGRWETTLSGDGGGTEYRVWSLPGGEEAGARSLVVLPDPFAMELDGADGTIARSSQMWVTWTPSGLGGEMRWTLGSGVECLWDTEGIMSDTGRLSLSGEEQIDSTPSADFAVDDPEDDSESCVATLCLYRDVEGLLGPLFGAELEGGYIRATRQVCQRFVSVP